MTTSVPQAVQSCDELLLWLIPQLDKFPRVRHIEMRLSRLRKVLPFTRFDELTVDRPAKAELVNLRVAQSG